MKAPAFQFYPRDFLVGVMGFSDEEIGIYIKMLAVQWERGSLPFDPKSIKKLIGSRKVPSLELLEKFPQNDDGERRNPRLEQEREKQASFRATRKRAAEKRWGDTSTCNARALQDGDNPDMHVHYKNDALQSASATAVSKTHSTRAHETPMLAEVEAYGKSLPMPVMDGCAAMFFNEHEASGWVDKASRPVIDWRAAFRAYASRWNQNERGRQKGGQSRPAHRQGEFPEPAMTLPDLPDLP